MMSFAFAGAAGTGKTTLAKAVAEKLNWHFHDASVSKIMREFGVNAVADLPLLQRIEAQEFLLERFLDGLRKAPRPMITDRTPLDMIAYMLGEITMNNSDEATGDRAAEYVTKCIEATRSHFDTIIIVRPLPEYTADPKRPAPNSGYQLQTQFLIEGAANWVQPNLYVEFLETTDLDERIEAASSLLIDRMAQLQRFAQAVHRH